jgi:adiponectin receptor
MSIQFGTIFDLFRCPERNNPGKYNLCGHSHQIWHGFVVLGIIFTYLGAL